MVRTCKCGCDHFRFSQTQVVEDEQVMSNLCANCDHTLVDHLPIARSTQAD